MSGAANDPIRNSRSGDTTARSWECLNCGESFTLADYGSVCYCSDACLAAGADR